MTNSFQSTAAANIYDSPVSTFVQPVTVLPKTGMMELAETLKVVNPALQNLIEFGIKREVEKDKERAVADLLDAEINGGAISDLSNKLEKSEGRQTAREIIGGSRAYRRQYEASLVELQAQKRGNRMNRDYDVARIDTGEIDENGQPIFKSLKEFSTDSNEYKTWRQNYLNEDLELFQQLGIDSTVVDDFYIPNMTKEMFKNANYGTKQNSTFEYNKFLGLMPEVLTEASLHLSKGEEDQAGEILNNYLENMYKGGITGTDATKTYTTLINNIYAQGEKLLDIDVSKPDAAQKLALAESFPDRLLSLVKYGEKDLRSHKDYLTKSAAFDEKFERLVLQKIKYKNQVQPLLNKLEIKNKFQNINKIPLTVDMTDAEKTTAIENKRNGYEALKNDPRFTTKEEQDYIDQLGKSDNFDLKSKIIPDLKKKITLGVFDSLDSDLEKAISDIENNHATMDNEAIDLIDKLKTFAANSDGLGEDIQASTTNIMNIVNDNLGVGDKFQILEPFSDKTRSNMLKSTKLGFEVRDKIKQYYIDYIETNGKRPTSLEVQAIEQQYAVQALASDGKPEFVKLRNELYPNAENPFKKSERQLYQEKIEGIDLNRTVPEGSFGIGTQENERTRRLQQQDTNNNFFEGQMNLGNVEGGAFSEGAFTTVDVNSGDTLSGFANDLDTSVEAIKKANGMTTNEIQIGDVLVIPEGITDPNKVNAPKFDMNKLITNKDHPFNPVREKHNFQVIYNIAKEIGIKFPELVAAQAMEETGFGKDQSADNNFLGLKATSSEVARGQSERKMTTEDRGQGRKPELANFKTFNNIREMMMQYKKEWNDNFLGRKGIVNAKSIEEAIKMLQAEDYATNKDYDKNVLEIIDRAIKEGWF